MYMNSYAPGEGNFRNVMDNDLGSYIDPIWKAIRLIVQNAVKRKDL